MDQTFEPPSVFFNIPRAALDDNQSQEQNRGTNIQKSKPRITFADEPVDSVETTNSLNVTTDTEKTVKKKKTSKFSLASFTVAADDDIVAPIVNQTPAANMEVTVNLASNEDELIYANSLGIKSPYPSGDYIPVISEKYKKRIDYGELIGRNTKTVDTQSRQKQREIEERVARDDVMDMFSSERREVVPEPVDEAERMNDLISAALKNLTSQEVYAKRDKSTPSSAILPETYIGYLYNAMIYLNAEERGIIILTCIFGGLITRQKLSGAGAKSGISKFPSLVSAMDSLINGGSNGQTGKLYTQIRASILSDKLNRFRSDVSASDQVELVTSLVQKLIGSKTPVHFPANISIQEPFPGRDANNKPTVPKTISLSGTPTILNLNNFFVKVVAKAPSAPSQKKSSGANYEDDNDANYEAEDRMTAGQKQRW